MTLTIDKEYTKGLVSRLEENGSVAYSVWTGAEIDWLLEDGAMDCSGGITAMAEEGIERSTGIKVDLASEGPVANCVVRTGLSSYQQHNTFIVSDGTRSRRDLASIKRDVDTIPKVTPQDSNYAASSLDFPMVRPSGTALDGMRIDQKENPYDQTFVNALTTIQILSHWGVDTSSLIEGLDWSYGIDYVSQIVAQLSLGKSKDLNRYIASGGRPSPCVYMSPNVLSRYTIDQSPVCDPTEGVYSSFFAGRAKALTKFIFASCNVFRGNGALMEFATHCNPAHMSKFNPLMLDGWVVDITCTESWVHCSKSIDGIESYKSFIGKRQPASVATRNDKNNILAALTSMDMHENVGVMGPSTLTQMASRQMLIANSSVSAVVANRTSSQVTTSRVTTMMYELFTGNKCAENYSALLTTCGQVMTMGSIPIGEFNVADIYRDLMSSKGYGEAIKHINLGNASKISGLITAMGQSHIDKRTIMACYLLRKQTMASRPNVLTALEIAAHTCLTKGKNMRIWPVYHDNLKKFRPNLYLDQLGSAAAAASRPDTLVYAQMSPALSSYSSGGGSRPKSMLAGVRVQWSRYHDKMALNWQNNLYLCTKMRSDGIGLENVRSYSMDAFDDLDQFMVATKCTYQELIRCLGLALAYKWVEVKVEGHNMMYDSMDPVIAAASLTKYTVWLQEINDANSLVTANPHNDKLWKSTHSGAQLDKQTILVLGTFGSDSKGNAKLKRVVRADIIMEYGRAVEKVRSSVVEAINVDARFFSRASAAEPTPTYVVPARRQHNASDNINNLSVVDLEAVSHLATMNHRGMYGVEDNGPAAIHRGRLITFAYEIDSVDPALADSFRQVADRLTDGYFAENRSLIEMYTTKIRACKKSVPAMSLIAYRAGAIVFHERFMEFIELERPAVQMMS